MDTTTIRRIHTLNIPATPSGSAPMAVPFSMRNRSANPNSPPPMPTMTAMMMPTGRVTNRLFPITAIPMTITVGISMRRPAGFWFSARRDAATLVSSPCPLLAPPKMAYSMMDMINVTTTYLERSFTAPPISALPCFFL